MNQLAKRLGEARRNALEQIQAAGWPVDIYHDVAWFPDMPAHKDNSSQSSKKRKRAERAHKMRASVLEIDIALAALNHFAETATETARSKGKKVRKSEKNEPDAIVEALEASINAIEALFAPDADIGRRQRGHGKNGGESKERTKPIKAVHQAWAEEDGRLQTENLHLTKSDRARLIAEIHNKRPENRDKQTKPETVRSALRRLKS